VGVIQLDNATRAAYAYKKSLDSIEDSENNYISRSAEVKNAIAKLEFTAADRSKSIAERKKAMDEALARGQEESQKMVDFAKQ